MQSPTGIGILFLMSPKFLVGVKSLPCLIKLVAVGNHPLNLSIGKTAFVTHLGPFRSPGHFQETAARTL